ncbi:MAG: hypothetical protein MI921_23770 [Cytophagales bacterium]|nr:hypothetical protein [Cytophagales bacterium]
MSSAGWFSLIKVILKHGHFAIPAYDYQKARQKELEKPDSYTPVGAIRKEAGFRHSQSILSLPILGPLTAFASYYKTQRTLRTLAILSTFKPNR